MNRQFCRSARRGSLSCVSVPWSIYWQFSEQTNCGLVPSRGFFCELWAAGKCDYSAAFSKRKMSLCVLSLKGQVFVRPDIKLTRSTWFCWPARCFLYLALGCDAKKKRIKNAEDEIFILLFFLVYPNPLWLPAYLLTKAGLGDGINACIAGRVLISKGVVSSLWHITPLPQQK